MFIAVQQLQMTEDGFEPPLLRTLPRTLSPPINHYCSDFLSCERPSCTCVSEFVSVNLQSIYFASELVQSSLWASAPESRSALHVEITVILALWSPPQLSGETCESAKIAAPLSFFSWFSKVDRSRLGVWRP